VRLFGAATLALALAGCATPPSGSGESFANLEGPRLAQLYVAIERVYRDDEKFRTDYDPPDAPYDAQTLTRNFGVVAQRSETQSIDGNVVIEGDSIPLTRWEVPLRLWTSGETAADSAHITALSQRVARLTDLSVERARDAQDANIYLLIADAEERSDLIRLLNSVGRKGDAPLVNAWPHRPEFPCIARVSVNPRTNTLEWAMILVKAELTGDFRKSCLTEEFIQALGLFNDGPEVRPSIFNDDAEFIELTRHDEYLLQILYDKRLRPGMLQGEAEPIVKTIAAELLADAGS